MAVEVGLKGRQEMEVTFETTVAAIDSSLPPVFATPVLVSLIEKTCNESIKPFLGEGEGAVGVTVNITHAGATPVGMKVWCESELIEITGKRSNKLLFNVNVYDENGRVGFGTHSRAIINMAAFMANFK